MLTRYNIDSRLKKDKSPHTLDGPSALPGEEGDVADPRPPSMASNLPRQPNAPGSGVLAPGSRLMGLKFMQRRAGQTPGQSPAAAPAAATMPGAAAVTPGSAGAASQPRSESQWTLESTGGDTPDSSARPRALADDDFEQPDSTSQLLQFRAGRRSFGKFNPRLEKRLTEIRNNQRIAAEEIANQARVAEERERQQVEQAALMEKADAAEAIERQNALSDRELAAAMAHKYGKYVPPVPQTARAAASTEPPVVEYPVQIRDAPSAQEKGWERVQPGKKRGFTQGGGSKGAGGSSAAKKMRR
jgi:hypothetical protein